MKIKTNLLTIEEMAGEVGRRTRYTFHELNNQNEQIIVELSHINCEGSLFKIWKEKKYISKYLKSWISIDTYVINEDGQCFGKYNPQHTASHKINFDWVLKDTKQNRQKILTKIAELAY